jgi:hypothetical protein
MTFNFAYEYELGNSKSVSRRSFPLSYVETALEHDRNHIHVRTSSKHSTEMHSQMYVQFYES